MSNILQSGEINVRSSLLEDLTVIHDEHFEYSVEAPMTAADFFKLVLRDLNTLSEQREILKGMDRLHSSIKLSEECIQSLEGQLLEHPTKLESLTSEVRGTSWLIANWPLLRQWL